MKLSPITRAVIAGVATLVGSTRPAGANEIWIAPTYQQDFGGVGVATHTWPVTVLGQVRFAFAVPADFLQLTGAKLVLVPQATVRGGQVNLVICRAAVAEFVDANCATTKPVTFSATAEALVEVDIQGALAPHLGAAGVAYMSIMATTSPSPKTDRFLGLRLSYDPSGIATLGSNTFTGTQVIASGNLDLSASGKIVQGGGVLLHAPGTSSTFLGRGAGEHSPSGSSNNTGIGFAALNRHLGFEGNTAVGSGAMRQDFFGSMNTAIGVDSLAGTWNSDTRSGNTAVGYRALATLDRGSGNVALGNHAGSNVTLGFNNIYIGNGVAGVDGQTNTMHLGANLYRTFISGVWNATTGHPTTLPVVVDQHGQLGTVSSSRRSKDDIRDMGATSQRLLALRPVSFRYKQKDAPIDYGLIAEEVAETFPELVVYGSDGQPQTVKYHTLNVLLLNELQAQQRRLEALERELALLRASRR